MITIEKIHLHQAETDIEFSMNPSGSDFLPFHSNINEPYHHNWMLKNALSDQQCNRAFGKSTMVIQTFNLSGIRILKEKP